MNAASFWIWSRNAGCDLFNGEGKVVGGTRDEGVMLSYSVILTFYLRELPTGIC